MAPGIVQSTRSGNEPGRNPTALSGTVGYRLDLDDRTRNARLGGSNPLRAAVQHASLSLGGFTGTIRFEPTAIGLEVRRSIRTELRALEVLFCPKRKKTLRSRVAARISGFPMVDKRARWE